MAKLLLYNIIRFVALVVLQVFLFKNVGYYNLATPFPYILFILLLPVGIGNFTLYAIAFATGLVVDAFYDTPGINAAAAVALAWGRIIFMRITLQTDNYESYMTPAWGTVPFRWFFLYVLVLSLFHHGVLFLLETFTFHQFHYTLIRILLSCIFTVIIILLFSLLFYRKKQR
ncbi:rod shape-determining protein MreD [Parapedobacter lycopersici]|uniref:rod shape-determining protein MreD n=1 Tax=Parapedobacter lycopersici TaxID=1864939 RepID=UPI00214D805F|nr:rod shape-determining protein MreD [Parapedobacter lycopersici]